MQLGSLHLFADSRATPEQHLQESDSLRIAAEINLKSGNLALASEAFWGMVAHLFQAIAERRGMRHESNLDFRSIRDWLIAETRNHDLNESYELTYHLHRNFYRITLTKEEIEIRAQYALALADAARPYAT